MSVSATGGEAAVLDDDVAADLPAVVADAKLTRQAARIKVAGGMSDAEAFAAATALVEEAVLFTGDPELLESAGWRVHDLRAGTRS